MDRWIGQAGGIMRSIWRGHGGGAGFFLFHRGEIPDRGNPERLGRVISPGGSGPVMEGWEASGEALEKMRAGGREEI